VRDLAANATLESTIPTQFNNNEDQNALYGTGAPNALEPVADQTLAQGVLEGRTLFAATGDTGSSCPVLVLGPDLGAGNGVINQGVPIVNYPAASPYVVAVGGTVLYPDGSTPAQRGLEYPWPYTGGGQSFFIRSRRSRRAIQGRPTVPVQRQRHAQHQPGRMPRDPGRRRRVRRHRHQLL